MKFKNLLVLAIICLCTNANSQDLAPGFKTWGSYALNWRVTKKASINFSQLVGINMNPFGFQFTQSDLNFEYRFDKQHSLAAGYKPNVFFSGGNINLYNRVYAEYEFRHTLFKLPIKHIVTPEFHFPTLRKYQWRFIYGFKYYFKNDFLPIKMTPYIKGQIFYYLNGRPLTYYDSNGEAIVKQSPNDFHRYRIGGGITMKPTSNFRLTFYYFYQQEFNTSLTENRDLNIPSKNGSKIKYPFNNYHVVGFSMTQSIKSYKKKKNKKRKNSNPSIN